jgi:2-dehydro-3-deoxy-D-arabinonate dehydratase
MDHTGYTGKSGARLDDPDHDSTHGKKVFAGETSVGKIKRTFEELAGFLFRSQVFPHGAVLLTGTGVVPADTFTLQERDLIEIEISGIGLLRNPVAVV